MVAFSLFLGLMLVFPKPQAIFLDVSFNSFRVEDDSTTDNELIWGA
jgi:hypothetical protein